MKEINEENFIKNVFSLFGVNLIKIDEKNSKSPDFITTHESHTILMELKTKNENNTEIEKRNNALDSNRLHLKTTSTARANRISKLMSKATKQLQSKKEEINADFCFVILHSSGFARSAHLEQFKNSIYGISHLVIYKEGSSKLAPCYYFYNSDFFNFREIVDGAFLIGEKSLSLCINDLSPRYKILKESSFIKKFQNGITDPSEEEKENKAYSLRESVNRESKEDILNHIKEKYHLDKVVDFNFPHISVISKISPEK